MLDKATFLHSQVHKYCFIARAVNFPVRCEPTMHVAQAM